MSESHINQHGVANEQLARDEGLLQFMVAIGGILKWEWQPRTASFRWSTPPEWLFGKEFDGARSIAELLPPKHQTRLLAAIQRALQDGLPFDLTVEVQIGKLPVPCVVRGSPQIEPGGSASVHGVLIDTGDRATTVVSAPANRLDHRGILLRNLPEVAWLKDVHGRFLVVNAAFSKRYDIVEDKAVGKTEFELFPRPIATRSTAEDREVLSKRTRITFESASDLDGRKCFVEVIKSPVLDGNGALGGTLGTLRDVTVRKKAEQRLHDSEQRFRMLAEMSSDSFWEQNAEFRFVSVNRRAGSALDAALPIGKTRWELPTADVSEEQWRAHRATLEAHLPFHNFEFAVVEPGGKRRHIVTSGRPLYGDDGAFCGYLGVDTDITKRIEAEASLRSALARGQVLLQTSPTAIALVKHFRIVHCNPAMERLFGRAPGTLAGKDLGLLYPTGEDWLHFEHSVREAIDRRDTFGDQVEFVREDGSRFWAMVAACEIESGSGEILYTFADITAQHTLMQTLVEAKEAATAANRSKSNFLAAMSHEIRTPMNGVLGMIELVEHTALDDDQRKSLQVARESATALLRLIDDILDFSKIEAGQLDIRLEPTSLAQTVGRGAAIFEEIARRKGLTFETRIDSDLQPFHLADGFRLAQIVNNLLSNAIKFTQKGGVVVELASEGRTADSEFVFVRIRDTGIGVTTEQKARLFKPFTQADGTTAKQYGGTGLGLSICKRLAELMGGSIDMQSTPGEGTTMTVHLRLALSDAQAATETTAAPALSPAVAAPETARLAILVVDDHPVNLQVMERQVGLLGHPVETARDGREALEKWQQGGYRIVLTDCNMPELDGYGLAREIRRLEGAGARPRSVVIACTANATASEAATCAAAGMDDYMPKPITLGVLEQKLARWLPVVAPDAAAAPPMPARAVLPAGDAHLPLDASVLDALLGDDSDTRRGILAQFAEADRADFDLLRQAVRGNDRAAASKTAHRIKGAAHMVGANDYGDSVEAFYAALRAQEDGTPLPQLDEPEREHTRLHTHLQEQGAGAP